VWVVLAGVIGAFSLTTFLSQDDRTEIPFSEYQTTVANGGVSSATVNNNNGQITGELVDGSDYKTNGPLELSPEERQALDENVLEDVEYETPTSSVWSSLIPLLLPVALLIGFFWWMQRRASGQMGGIMSIGRSKAKTYSTERPGTTFEDVAGYEGVKQEITEIVDFLKEPDKFTHLGARIPKGVLLVGPPGTGKTLIARAVAGEAGVPFMSVTGSDFMEMFVGVGASRVRDLFQSARKMGRAIIFIDEIDSIGRKRGAGLGGGHDEREQTLNQMLSEMDGFEATEGIVMIAATNRPDILDSALLRPGRFDRQVVVPLPELSDREEILRRHIEGKKVKDLDLNVLARGTPGMSGADLANLVNEAALYAVRAGDEEIGMDNFEQARDRVIMGQRRESMVLSAEEKEAIAYHESGHAICAALLPTADPLHKVTIIPSGMALGVTMQLPEEERHIYRQDYMEDSLVVLMGGRIAESLVFNVISTGANNDLIRATEIGPMAWGSHDNVFLGEEIVSHRSYSDRTAHIIDSEVEVILRSQEDRCRLLLGENRGALDLVARALLEHETIDGAEVTRLISVATESSPGTTNGAEPKSEALPLGHLTEDVTELAEPSETPRS
jgi:cell division protease FtsH